MAPGASDYLTVEYHSRELPSFPSDDEGATAGSGVLIIPKKNRNEICKYLFKEGVLYAKKDYNLAKHPQIDYLTNDGIEHLRNYLNLRSEIVPATLKKSAKPPGRPFGSSPPGDRPRERRDLVWGRREEMRG
uniref:Plectin/eS10 N-terminal domain-containing protein n=1 Tax=Zea mays TaxID=4577 RepID=A0A804LNR2_MAIZE